MNTRRVVFLGSKRIGLECLRVLCDSQESLGFHIVGVLTNQRGSDIRNLCAERCLSELHSLDEYLRVPKVDLAISVQYHKILKREHIDHAKLSVNLHMAPLPEYRGCNQFSFAIIDGASHFGTTIHKLEEGVDSGAIIAERRFRIDPSVWVSELYERTFEESLLLFRSALPALLEGTFNTVSQDALIADRGTSCHYRSEIEEIKKLDLSWPEERIQRHIRATYMPGFSPPYFVCAGKKVQLLVAET